MRIRWTELAVTDFTQICDRSNAEFGMARARRTALQIYGAVDVLRTFPHLGRTGRKAGTYELVIRGLPFVTVYRIQVDSVEVIRVLHGSQKWP